MINEPLLDECYQAFISARGGERERLGNALNTVIPRLEAAESEIQKLKQEVNQLKFRGQDE